MSRSEPLEESGLLNADRHVLRQQVFEPPLLLGEGAISGVISSEERRIWIVRDKTEIYRCADTAPDNEPPRPMCVRVPFTAGTSP